MLHSGWNVSEAKQVRADARRNRARVLLAAKTAFAADGLSVSVDEIAQLASVGPGTVYRHFPTKEALFAAVVQERLESLAEQARELRASEDPGAALFTFIHRMVAEAAPKRDLVDALAQAGVSVTAELAGAGAILRDEVGQLLARAQRAGSVRDDVDTDDLMALLSGTMSATLRPVRAIAPARAADILCAGLLPPR
jgi:AcrR family transcriptional regulator